MYINITTIIIIIGHCKQKKRCNLLKKTQVVFVPIISKEWLNNISAKLDIRPPYKARLFSYCGYCFFGFLVVITLNLIVSIDLDLQIGLKVVAERIIADIELIDWEIIINRDRQREKERHRDK